MVRGGSFAVVALIFALTASSILAQQRDLNRLEPGERVADIQYCQGHYRITTADGKTREIAEYDIQLKTDSSKLGPRKGAPALVPAGRAGDRFHIVFANPSELGSAIKQSCGA